MYNQNCFFFFGLCISRIFWKLDIFLRQMRRWGGFNWSWHNERKCLSYWINCSNINCNILSSEHFRNWLISVRFITGRSGNPVRLGQWLCEGSGRLENQSRDFSFLTSVASSALESLKTLTLRAGTWHWTITSIWCHPPT